MVVLQMRGNGKVQERNKDMNQKPSLSKVEKMGPKNCVVDASACSNMLRCLKGLALDPCGPETLKDLAGKLQNQTLTLRKVWHSNNSECSKKKRKLEQFLQGKYTKASGSASQNSKSRKFETFGCKQLDSASGLPDLAVGNSCSSGSVLTFDSTFQRNATNWPPFNNSFSCQVDTEESINSSKPSSLENFIAHNQTLEDSSELISSSNSSSSEEKLLQVRSLITESEGENLPRAVIPIGPGFQAEIPEWKGPINKKDLYGCDGDSESLKWLGTKIWPLKGKSSLKNRSSKVIGRGRPDSCHCDSPGSKDCIRCHMLSARHDLQSNLGPAFFCWKFDEIGEVVSKAWTLREQEMFKSFVKNNPLPNAAGFWEAISKLFPSKSKKTILSYYYNVFIPRRLGKQTCFSCSQVDSDEDQIDDDENKGLCWRRYKAKHDI